MGRSSIYTDELAEIICDRLAAGESLNAICMAEEMPGESTVRAWVLDNRQGFAAKYARAREIQAERLFDEILAIADDGRRDYVKDEDGNDVVDHDHIKRAVLRVDARKWYLSKVLPKKYGDKLAVDVKGDMTNRAAQADPAKVMEAMRAIVKGGNG